jgi:hypothetical protein
VIWPTGHAGLPRYIATVETAKHRAFQFLGANIAPDNMLVCIASACSPGRHLEEWRL